ncbi:MAG TPA: DinB family protein [Candidatus Acidoferrales bacterium]|nr:DinB family protein [Candidatus Acidoferrales bacterium]
MNRKRSPKKKASRRAKPSAPKQAASARSSNSIDDKTLRALLVKLLEGGGAHIKPGEALADFPEAKRGIRAGNSPHTAWQLFEHLRIAQWDILEFSRNARHVSPKFPEGYWPSSEMPPSATAWETSVKAFGRDLQEMQELVSNPKTDLFARIPHGDGQTILREALVLADHNSYHLGQLVLLRKMLDAWPAA